VRRIYRRGWESIKVGEQRSRGVEGRKEEKKRKGRKRENER
jgi:hypothetical protein